MYLKNLVIAAFGGELNLKECSKNILLETKQKNKTTFDSGEGPPTLITAYYFFVPSEYFPGFRTILGVLPVPL